MPLSKDMSHEEIVKELMDSYRTNGKINNYTPKSEEKALEMANAIAYSFKRKNG